MDVGFGKIGFRATMAVDFDAAAVDSYNHNFEGEVAVQADLSKSYGEKLLVDYKKKNLPMPTGIIGGPPCQGFSVSNWRADGTDPRNQLPYRFSDTLKAFNESSPVHFFVFENVVGLKAPKHQSRFNRIKKRFSNIGFKVHEKVINAAEFGVAQQRKRLFIIGLNEKLYGDKIFSFPEGTTDRISVREMIESLPDPAYFSHRLEQSEIPHHVNHWTMMPKSTKFKTGNFGDGRSFRKLQWDEPSPTVAYGHREIHVHPNGKRRLSIHEAMLLQGFSKDFELKGTLSEQVTQVSNAVPPPVAEAIAMAVLGTCSQKLRSKS